MGADLIGWRGCELQRGLGPQGFLGKLKMKSYLTVIEERVPPAARATVKVQVVVHRPEGPVQRALGYDEIREEAATFQRGVPACASCPLAGGAPVGCYRYVTYPIDATTERTVFELFAAEVGVEGSAAQRFHRARVAPLPASGTGWHQRRGGDAQNGALAELSAPLAHAWGGWFSRKKLDSAQLLLALVNPAPDAPSLALHTELLDRLAAFATERGARARGLDELSALRPFFHALARGAKEERWSIVVDA